MTRRDPRGELRSERLRAALERALAGSPEELVASLLRGSGLPGPRANFGFAQAVGEALADAGKPGIRVAVQLASTPTRRDGPEGFLRVCAAYAFSARLATVSSEGAAWSALAALAADEEAIVRMGVERALIERLVAARPGDVDVAAKVVGLCAEFGTAATALNVLSAPRVLEGAASRSWHKDAFELAFGRLEASSRADERALAFRRALDALERAIAAALPRVRGVDAWLVERAGTSHRVLRAMVERSLDRAVKAGVRRASVDGVNQALDDHAPHERTRGWDPTVHTRRGKRATRRRT